MVGNLFWYDQTRREKRGAPALSMGEGMASTELEPTETGRAADKLFDHFVALIQSGELAQGQTLPPEREIVESHGVSRTVVRETVQALANRGFVEARPRHRPVVRRPVFDTAFETVDTIVRALLAQPKGVNNLFETRILLEAALAREAAKSATDKDCEALKKALAANESAICDPDLFFRTDIGFHKVLYEISGNPLMLSVHRAYSAWLTPSWIKMRRGLERNVINYQAHADICDGVVRRDPDAAEDALRAHLEYAWTQLREHI